MRNKDHDHTKRTYETTDEYDALGQCSVLNFIQYQCLRKPRLHYTRS